MTQYLPPNLLALFAPREPLPFLPPACRQPHEKKTKGYSGVAQYLDLFEDPKDTPLPTKIETREERLERKKREKAEKATYIREQGIALWDPNNNDSASNDPYKTLFIARINPDTSESKLKREFETYGPIRSIHIVRDKITRKPKGYAFVEFKNEKDMHSAYKYGDGKKIDDRRVLVDVERGRTVKGWLPRRLGGGLGFTSKTREERNGDRGYRTERMERTDRNDRTDRGERNDRSDRADRPDRNGSDRPDRNGGDRGDRRKRDRDRDRRSVSKDHERKRHRTRI